jgi:hypothetical protein
MRIILAVLAIVIAAAAASVIAGSTQWTRATRARASELNSAAVAAAIYHETAIAALPEPAMRYFRRVLRDGQRMVRSAVATQDAEFFINGAWRPLSATQQFLVSPPGFVWDARISMAPLLPAFVRDSYVGGKASMTASMLGVYTLVDQHGAPELNSGALQRLLGESVWMPTALLPSDRIRWTARDDRSATVTLRDSGIEVSLVFDVDSEGHVVLIRGDRFKEDGGAYAIQPWHIRCDEYRERDGLLIPLHCEVAWVVNGTPEPYWRGRIASITYRYN